MVLKSIQFILLLHFSSPLLLFYLRLNNFSKRPWVFPSLWFQISTHRWRLFFHYDSIMTLKRITALIIRERMSICDVVFFYSSWLKFNILIMLWHSVSCNVITYYDRSLKWSFYPWNSPLGECSTIALSGVFYTKSPLKNKKWACWLIVFYFLYNYPVKRSFYPAVGRIIVLPLFYLRNDWEKDKQFII